jgi:hypothetical protein
MFGTRVVAWFAAVALVGLGASEAFAQKGMGDQTGVARQAVKPEVVSLSGKITEVESGPCKATTGRSTVGTHVLLKAKGGKELNIHLGPQAEVADVAERLKVGERLAVKAFRTEKMPEGHYVAQVLKLGDETVELRDAALRPVWAGGQAMGRGRGGYRPGADQGYRQRQADGRAGARNCPRRGGPPQGRGPGRGGPRQGRGAGWGTPAQGPGRGPGWEAAPQGQGPGWGARGQCPRRGAGPAMGQGRGVGRGAGLGQQQRQGRGPGYGRGR